MKNLLPFTAGKNISVGKFNRDLIWNIGSFGVVAVTGMLFQVLIARVYGPSTLGAFNQAIALYIVFSQLSTSGIHLAVLQRISVLSDLKAEDFNLSKVHANIATSLITVAAIASVLVVLGYALSGLFGAIFSSDAVRMAWLYILPGLWFFSLNKVLLNIVNGLRNMLVFALGQSARYILMLIGLVLFILFEVEPIKLALIVTLTEAVLFFSLLIYVRCIQKISIRQFNKDVARDQLSFGFKGLWGNTLTDLNARVDVIVLGIFIDDHIVGIYTLAAIIFDGLFQFLIVLRNVFNPVIAACLSNNRVEEFNAKHRKIAKIAYFGTITIGLCAILIYPYFIDLIIGDASFHEGLWPLIILVGGLSIAAGWLPLDMLLIQAGYPAAQSILKLMTVGTNIAFACLLVPLFGMVGAAAASATSIVLSILWLKIIAKNRIGISV